MTWKEKEFDKKKNFLRYVFINYQITSQIGLNRNLRNTRRCVSKVTAQPGASKSLQSCYGTGQRWKNPLRIKDRNPESLSEKPEMKRRRNLALILRHPSPLFWGGGGAERKKLILSKLE